MDEEIVFSIDYLISPSVEKLLDGKTPVEQADIFVKLINYNKNYPDIADEIKDFIKRNMGDNYRKYNIPDDEVEVIREYATLHDDIKKLKDLISGICDENRHDEAVAEINAAITEKKKEIKEKEEKRKMLASDVIDNLCFEEGIGTQTKEKSKVKKYRTLEDFLKLIDAPNS